MMMRYHIGFKKPGTTLPPLEVFEERIALDMVPKLFCKRQRVTLKLWDDAEVDGDTVSVLLNGGPVLVRHCQGHKPVKLAMDTGFGHNWNEVVAHNEG